MAVHLAWAANVYSSGTNEPASCEERNVRAPHARMPEYSYPLYILL